MKPEKPTKNREDYLKSKEYWLKELSSYNILEKDYKKTEKEISKKFGEKAKTNDIIWSLFNEAIIKNINDFLKQYHIYYLMGNFIRSEGKNDPNQYFELSTKSLLQSYKLGGIKKIRFVASSGERTCKSCSKLNGKIFDIEDALKKIPVPNKACKNLDEHGYIYCRCTVIAITELS